MNPYIPSPTPFYGNFNRTTMRRSNCAGHEPYKNYVLATAGANIQMHTMQIITEGPPTVLTIVVEEITGAASWIVTTSVTYMVATDKSGKGLIVIPEQTIALPGVEIGKFYRINVDSTQGIAYSEEVYTTSVWPGTDPTCAGGTFQAVKLTWGTSCPVYFGGKHDTTPWRMFLLASFGPSDWQYEEDGKKDAKKEDRLTLQYIEKYYSLELVGPEYIADALWHTALYPDITLEFADGEIWAIKRPKVGVQWLTKSCFAKITYSFQQNNLKRIGCGTLCQ